MNWSKIILITITLTFFVSLILVDRKINIAITNTTDNDTIRVYLNIERNKTVEASIVNSIHPKFSQDFEAKCGFQKITVKCPELGISKDITIFNIYKNNIEFEFTKDVNDNHILVIRNSWFELNYE
ncbi:MAG: hypothetical protein AB7S50_14245 [Bacteroidales bacterium]